MFGMLRSAIVLAVLTAPALAYAGDGSIGRNSNADEKVGPPNTQGIGIKSAGNPYRKDGSFDPAGRTDPANSSDPATKPKIDMPH